MYNEVTYKIINNHTGQVHTLVSDPKNWDASEPTLKRSTKTFGVHTEYSKNLEFTKDGKTILNNLFAVYDIEADATLQRWRSHPTNDSEYLEYELQFDFSDYNPKDTVTKISFKTGGLDALIESQFKEKFELERLTAINGNTINALDTVQVALTGREILLISELETTDNSSTSHSNVFPGRVPNLTVVSNSDSENIAFVLDPDDSFVFADPYNNPQKFFYLKSDRAKTIKVKVDFDITVESAGATSYRFRLFLFRYSFDSTDYNHEETYYIYNTDGDYSSENRYSGIVEQEINLDTDDSVMFVVECTTNVSSTQVYHYLYDGTVFSNTGNHLNITVTEDSEFDNTQTKAVLMHEAGDKLMQIITGEQNRYYSEFYGRTDLGYSTTGTYALTGLALGLWIRNFNDYSIEMALKDFLESSNVTHNTGYTIEKINGVETLVHEDLKYFFQDATVLNLGEVTDLEFKVAKEFYDSSLIFGYKNPSGDNLYEEAMGLDEYNTQTNFTTPFTRIDTKYEKISEFRADAYGKEFARRKQQLNYPEEDTRYDKNIFLLDLKTGLGLAYEERIWSDDYAAAPTNIYSPETATNLRFTPSELERRHQWFYGSGLRKDHFQSKYIRYANSLGNSELSTQKTGESARAENDNVLISTIEKSRFVPLWATFENEMTYDISTGLYGKTVVNGREIPNYFFKVKYTYKGQKYKGYIFEVTLKDKAKWKLLTAL